MLEPGSVVLLAAVTLTGAAGALAGWKLRQRGEDERRRAIEASAEEFVAAAGRARDRERAEREAAEARLREVRREHKRCGGRIERLESERDEARAAAGIASDEPEGEPAAEALPAVARTPLAVTATTPATSELEPLAAPLPLAAMAVVASEPQVAPRAWAAKTSKRPPSVAEPVSPSEPPPPPLADPAVVDAVTRARRKLAGKDGQRDGKRRGDGHRGRCQSPRARRGSAAKATRPEWLLDTPEGPRDDLKAIRGIGPGLEHHLNGLGIFHYRQLAHLTDAEADWLGNQLPVRGRVRRDRWSQQARLILSRRSSSTP